MCTPFHRVEESEQCLKLEVGFSVALCSIRWSTWTESLLTCAVMGGGSMHGFLWHPVEVFFDSLILQQGF